jgi:hypothetical protein
MIPHDECIIDVLKNHCLLLSRMNSHAPFSNFDISHHTFTLVERIYPVKQANRTNIAPGLLASSLPSHVPNMTSLARTKKIDCFRVRTTRQVVIDANSPRFVEVKDLLFRIHDHLVFCPILASKATCRKARLYPLR